MTPITLMRWSTVRVTATITVLVLGFTSFAAAQATTGTVAGTVKDAQGGIIPGATVTLISETRGTSFETQSGATGDFVVSNIPGDSYTIRVAMDGFKTSERKGVRVTPGDRVAAGAVTLDVGTLAETVMVSGDAPMIQAQTGERSFTVARESVEALPVTGRNFATFATLTPGVVAAGTGAVRADGARTNYLLDGISSVDTGGNQQGLQINPDAIAEVKVIATAYQAEYGRTSGIQISGVTKSGTNQFKGSFFDLERRTIWNANTWANARNGNAKPVADQRDWGYTLGGPVGKPGGKNNLFFFYAEQFQPRKSGGTINRFRVPTALERQGDFSESTDNTGARFNLIRDSTTNLPCTAANMSGCFQADGVLGRIPQDRLYGLGLNILKLWPLPNTNTPGVAYNLQTVAPEVKSNTFQHVIRVDYQLSSRLRMSAKYAGSNAPVFVNPGSIPGFNDQVNKFPANLIPSATVDYTLNSSTVFEGTWGLTQGNERAGNGVMVNQNTNKNNVGLGGFPTLYPDAVVPVGSYQERVLKAMNVPFYVNGRIQLPPQFSWGSRIGTTGVLAPPNTLYNGFLCWQRTNDVALSITKLWGAHTFKAGYQSQDSLKQQNVGTQTTGVLPPEGSVNFGQDSNNPLDTGFGFANAAIGVFTDFRQQNALIEGTYVYHNKDFYLQDNWKLNNKLTLDYGMRFTHHGPQYDEVGQASNFFSDQWSVGKAPQLYQPGCSTTIGATGCPTANRVAVNPNTGVSLGPGTALAIGTIVPNTGVLTNGIIQQGHGISKANYTESPMSLGPRAGAAYDLTGEQKYVLRGSMGYFYDRAQGDTIFGQSGNPPTGQQSTVFNSTLQSIAAGATAIQPAPAMLTYFYDAEIGSSLNWAGGMQMVLPWSSSLDVSYVGAHNYNSIAYGSISTPAGQLPIDRNAPDTGTAYLSQYQDPTLVSTVPGATALSTDLLRPYRGIGAITTTWPRFHTQYDSIQTAYNRRFSHGWQAGFNWTLGLRFVGNTLSPQHLVHNADGTITNAAFQAEDDALLSNVGLRRHIIKANFVWNLPDVKGTDALSKVLAAAANGWQLSGIFTGGSGLPYDATYSYQTAGSNVNLTGSPSYAARIKVVGDPGKGCSSNQYAQFNPAAFQGPGYNSIGNESGTNLLTGCADRTMDLSIQRNISVGGSRQLQFRLDAFNVFNTVIINARATAITYNSPATPTTIQNNQYASDGTLNPLRLTPATAGAGAATGAQGMRTLQAQLRFMF